MEANCGTRYLNTALQYSQLYQYNCGAGVEGIMRCYLWPKDSPESGG